MYRREGINVRTDQGDIWKIRPRMVMTTEANRMTHRLEQVLRNWIRLAETTYEGWGVRPRCGYFFGGAYWYGLETAHTLYIYTVLALFTPGAGPLSREQMIDRAISAIRYLCFTHDTGPAECVRVQSSNKANSGTKWGGKHDRFFMATQVGGCMNYLGIAAWLLWDQLDDETRSMIQRMIAGFADRWMDESPHGGTYYDTQTDENGVTAIGIFTAAFMFPEHPHNSRWWEAFQRWNVNSLTLFRDCKNNGLIKGVLAQKRVSVVTVHPDYTTENHGFVHPTYLVVSLYHRSRETIALALAGMPLELLDRLNDQEVYEHTIKRWSLGDAIPVSVQGQDWWFNQHHLFTSAHAYMNCFYKDSTAASLAELGLTYIEGLQNSNDRGCLLEQQGERCQVNPWDDQTAMDMEPLSAVHMANMLMMEVLLGGATDPKPPEEVEASMSGVFHYPFGGFVVHRLPDSVSTFSWRNHVMAMTLAKQGVWLQTPLYESYVGTLAPVDPGSDHIPYQEQLVYEASRQSIDVRKDGFAAYVRLERGTASLLQHAGFVSLPDGRSLYFEMFEALDDVGSWHAETGIIGIRNEHYTGLSDVAAGCRTLYVQEQSRTFTSWIPGGVDTLVDYSPANYVNLDNKAGYLLYGSQGVRYLNQHVFEKWKGGEDRLILNHRPTPLRLGKNQTTEPFVIVTLPNRTREETISAAVDGNLFVVGRACAWTDGKVLVWFNCAETTMGISCMTTNSNGECALFAGMNRIQSDHTAWSGNAAPSASGYHLPAGFVRVVGASMGETQLDIAVTEERIIFLNNGASDAFLEYTADHTGSHPPTSMQLAPGTFCVKERIGS